MFMKIVKIDMIEMTDILYPAILMMLLTLFLYVKNYLDNRKGVANKEIKFSYFKAYREKVPEYIDVSRQTLKNQFELPIFFYFLICLILIFDVLTITDLIFASRKELITEYDLRLDGVEAHRGVPLYEWPENYADAIEPLDSPRFIMNKYFFINLLIPALERPLLQSQYARALRNGIVATLYAVGIHQLDR